MKRALRLAILVAGGVALLGGCDLLFGVKVNGTLYGGTLTHIVSPVTVQVLGSGYYTTSFDIGEDLSLNQIGQFQIPNVAKGSYSLVFSITGQNGLLGSITYSVNGGTTRDAIFGPPVLDSGSGNYSYTVTISDISVEGDTDIVINVYYVG